jgi:hypothetical protein
MAGGRVHLGGVKQNLILSSAYSKKCSFIFRVPEKVPQTVPIHFDPIYPLL